MAAISSQVDADEASLARRIDQKLLDLRRNLDADYIRLWRYVDSQKVIFGFRWFAADDEDLTVAQAFGNYVGFRRRPLQPSGTLSPVSLTNGEHPYWYFPELRRLKPNSTGFVEAVLARSEREHDLDALVCAGTSLSTWGHIQLDAAKLAVIKNLLLDLHSLVQLYSLQRFHSAFIVAGEVQWSPLSSLLDVVQPPTPHRILATLAENLDSKASFYLRNPGDLTLYAGVGSFYEQLKAFEDPDGADALADQEYKSSLISAYAAPSGADEPTPVLFPGSPDVETYQGIRERFDTWVKTVIRLSKDKKHLRRQGENLGGEFQEIGRSGSFGVFPVWAHDVRTVQALLCVASMDRNFFRWKPRIAIQDACQWLSYNLPAAKPLRNLLRRVSEDVGVHLRQREDLRRELLPKALGQPRDRMRKRRRSDRGSKDNVYLETVSAFVMSVDIRRSTQLMRDTLKPEEYAAFLTNLSMSLAEVVKKHYGVFDKFTGDGILAFFPTCFFAGDAHAAALWTIAAAERCHAGFEEQFGTLRSHLAIVEAPQGLGIGIDFGENVALVDVSGELTVVGSPVVYACRLAAAPAGVTLLNEQAYQQISRDRGCGDFEEQVLPTKDRKMRARAVPRSWSQEVALPDKFYWTQ